MKLNIKTAAQAFMILAALLLSANATATIVEGKAPDFTLKSAKGSNLKLSEHRGEVVMINFWASWCAPCREEMPILNDMYLRYRDMGFTLLGVNVEEDSSAAKKMIQDLKVVFPVLYDTSNDVSKLYSVEAMPSTILVDRDGNMRYLHRGYLPGYEEDYERQVRELMRE
jgi:peroxiredoxin